MDFSRRFKELTAGESYGEIGRKLDYTAPRIGQVARGERPSREFVERLVEAYGLDREEWLALAGLGLREPKEDERTFVANLAATAAVRQLLEEIRVLTPSDRLLDWLRSIQTLYGRQVEIHFAGGASGLTHEQVDNLIAYHEARIAREGWEPIAPKDEPILTNRTKGES
jgi:hypothetical protein